MKYTKTELKNKMLLNKLNDLLIENNLSAELVYSLTSNFYKYGNENFIKGMEAQKEILNNIN